MRPLISLLLVLCLIAAGTIGYKVIGGPDTSLADCLYMTVITVSTVGYAEIIDMSGRPWARLFTVGLILSGMGVLLYFVSHITAFIVEGTIQEVFVAQRIARSIRRVQGHYVICGASEIAQHIAEELIATGHVCVVVSDDRSAIEALRARAAQALWIVGRPDQQSALRQAGAERAGGVFAALDDDRDNLAVILAVRAVGCRARIVVRAIMARSEPKLLRAGADRVVLSEQICGRRMTADLLYPSEANFLEMMLHVPDRTLRVEEVGVVAGSELIGKCVPEAQVKSRTGALVLAIRRGRDGPFAPPYKTTRIAEGDVIIAITDLAAKARLRRLARSCSERPSTA